MILTRFRCDYCRRSFASKRYASMHETRCSRNPANRTCSTCVHFERTPCCDTLSDECGCKGLNACAVDAFVTWRFDDHDTHAPKADGWWTHVEDWRRDCPLWAAHPVEADA